MDGIKRKMLAVGVEGDFFWPHWEGLDCRNNGCLPMYEPADQRWEERPDGSFHRLTCSKSSGTNNNQ